MKNNLGTFPRRQDDQFWDKIHFLGDKFSTACTQWRSDVSLELREMLKANGADSAFIKKFLGE